MAADKPLVITAGEPAGVGPELCDALADSRLARDIVIIGDKSLQKSDLPVIDMPFPAPVVHGQPDPGNARTLLNGLERAVRGCLDGEFSGLVTAPLAKSVIADAGIAFTGHTEFLAHLAGNGFGMLGALRLARYMLVAETDFNNILCITADRFPEGAIYEQAYNLISDGAAACLVSREKEGFKLLDVHHITNNGVVHVIG